MIYLVVQVSIGGWHCLALDSGGTVYAWGGNEYGQCHVEWDVRRSLPSYSCCTLFNGLLDRKRFGCPFGPARMPEPQPVVASTSASGMMLPSASAGACCMQSI